MPENELLMLKESYNSMIDYLNEMFTRLLEKEKVIQKAEMRVLHEQIKPHFLYNSLETISYMALEAKAPNVHSALETLGSFYRNFLSKGDREIPLEREVQIVRDYLSLQKLRYGDILNDEYDIAEDTEELMIPKLILQPLVENSIYHGIKLQREKGSIKVEAVDLDDRIELVVKDNGAGMTEERLQEMRAAIVNGEKIGFGLRTVHERMQLLFGEEYGLSISSTEGVGTTITVVIPKQKQDEKGIINV